MRNNYINSSFGIGIALDTQNTVLLAYDLTSRGEIDKATEGILNELNSAIAIEVGEHFDIKLEDYNVSTLDESFSMKI
jgi:hypothetical protein